MGLMPRETGKRSEKVEGFDFGQFVSQSIGDLLT